MPEEQVKTDTGKSTEAETVQIDKAELEGLKANQFSEDAKERADSQGYSNVEQYLEMVEGFAFDKPEPTPKEPESQKPAEAPKKVETPVPVEIPKELLDSVEQAKGMATAAYMQTSFTAYDMENKAKPEAERSKYSRDDLLKVINGPRRASVQHLSSNDTTFGGNVYAVADFLLSHAADSKRRQEETAKSNEALNKAEQTATIDSTTVSAPAPKDDK